jgi:hypothetical protein
MGPWSARVDHVQGALHPLHEGKQNYTCSLRPPDSPVLTILQAFYSSIVVYNVAVCLTKISIVLQYRRIFVQTFLRHITLGFLILLSAWAITLSVMLPLVCTPVESFWNRAVPGRCMNFKTVWYVMAGVNVATDFALFIMPIPVVNSLQLPRRQKLILLAIFGLGVL